MESSDNLVSFIEATKLHYSMRFGRPPTWVSLAPGRVNLMGDHVDYCGGWVLPMAIGRYTVVAGGRARADGETTAISLQQSTECRIDMIQPFRRDQPEWGNYLRGVLDGFARIASLPFGLDLMINSEVPTGGGLSSSAALEVAVARLIADAFEIPLEPVVMAHLCQKAEHEFACVPCGIMDQYVSVLAEPGCCLLLDCRDLRARQIPFPAEQFSILVVDSHVQHDLAESAYARRRQRCQAISHKLGIHSLRDLSMESLNRDPQPLSDLELKRARHVFTENQRAQEMAERLSGHDGRGCGALMYASHASLRDDYEVSCSEIDRMVDSAKVLGIDGGVYGARMTGGGFGGSMIALVDAKRDRETMNELLNLINANRNPGQPLATGFLTLPAAGACSIDRRRID